MNNPIDKIGENKLVSNLNDPFNKNNIKRINVSFRELTFTPGTWVASGVVNFRNGNTEGTQNFEGESFDDVVLQIKQFINSEL